MQKTKQTSQVETVTMRIETYQALLEDRLLQRLRGDNLQRKNAELIQEVDDLREELDTAKAELDKSTTCAKESENSAVWWMEKCQKAEQERDAMYKALGLGEVAASGDEPKEAKGG